MNEALTYSRLAVRLLTDLEAARADSTDDEPEELKLLGIVLTAFDEVDSLVERRILMESKHGHKPDREPKAGGENSDES